MVKVDSAFLQITHHEYVFQKYKGVIRKTYDNRNKTTDYEVLTIDGIAADSENFNIIRDIIINDLKR